MALSIPEISNIQVASFGLFCAPAMGDSLFPIAVIHSTSLRGHLTLAVAESVLKHSDVKATVGELKDSRAMRTPVLLLSFVELTPGSFNLLLIGVLSILFACLGPRSTIVLVRCGRRLS